MHLGVDDGWVLGEDEGESGVVSVDLKGLSAPA